MKPSPLSILIHFAWQFDVRDHDLRVVFDVKLQHAARTVAMTSATCTPQFLVATPRAAVKEVPVTLQAIHDNIVEVPQIEYIEVVKEVPKVEIRYVEKIVEVPKIEYVPWVENFRCISNRDMQMLGLTSMCLNNRYVNVM